VNFTQKKILAQNWPLGLTKLNQTTLKASEEGLTTPNWHLGVWSHPLFFSFEKRKKKKKKKKTLLVINDTIFT
jgi:hypothetical protein